MRTENWEKPKSIFFFLGFYAWKMSTKHWNLKTSTESFISTKIVSGSMSKIMKNAHQGLGSGYGQPPLPQARPRQEQEQADGAGRCGCGREHLGTIDCVKRRRERLCLEFIIYVKRKFFVKIVFRCYYCYHFYWCF